MCYVSYPNWIRLSVIGGLLIVIVGFIALFASPTREAAGTLCIGAGVALIGLLSAKQSEARRDT